MIKRCARCVMPETEGHILLDENGICTICNKQLNRRQTGSLPVHGGLPELRDAI
jgi:hypothetical protein